MMMRGPDLLRLVTAVFFLLPLATGFSQLRSPATGGQGTGYASSTKVSPAEYQRTIGLTGSYRVNREAADAYQAAALQEARRIKRIKEQMGVSHSGLAHRSQESILSNLIPSEDQAEGESAGGGESRKKDIFVPDYRENRDYGPPLAARPRSEPAPAATEAALETSPRRGVFAKLFRKNGSGSENPFNGEVQAGQTLSPPPSGSSPSPAEVPTFAPSGSPATPGNASPAPSRKKGLFSRIFSNPQGSGFSETAPLSPPAQATPLANYPGNEQPQAMAREIGSTGATGVGGFSVVRGAGVQADAGGEKISLPGGTRVRILTRGASETEVQLSDSRVVIVPNASLAPESE